MTRLRTVHSKVDNDSKIEIVLGRVENIGKRRKCWLPVF